MSEKVYSIASPSICTKEKSHVVTIGSGPNRNERTYSISITPANTENKNDVEYLLCIAPYARHKAVTENNAIVTATKVRAKGVLSSALEEAIRQNEIDVSISNTTDFELTRIIDVANLETQQSQRIDSIPVQLISADESIQHERIFDIDHIEGVESERPNERTAVVHHTDELQLITREYESAQIIEQDILKNTLREFVAAGVDELPEWVKVARVLYGEEFYEEVSQIVTREMHGEYNEGTISNIVSPAIDALINTEDISETKRKELETRVLDDYETFTTEHELQASIEEFDLFEGMGIPVYLPEFDLFGRIRKELETRITLFEDNSKTLQIIQMQMDQTIESKKVMKEHTTAVIQEVTSYKQNTQQALITEQETFIGIREFEGGVISDSTPADKEVITTDTEVIKNVDAVREFEQYAIVSEQELLERQVFVEAVTNETDTFDREHELESVTEEYERFERKPERESVLEDTEQFKLERVFDTEKPDELIVIEKENDDPKLWLRHSRQSWWTNSNWKKTR
ncbi:hypothetical protein [Bacillus sp. MN7755]